MAFRGVGGLEQNRVGGVAAAWNKAAPAWSHCVGSAAGPRPGGRAPREGGGGGRPDGGVEAADLAGAGGGGPEMAAPWPAAG
nr:unnamed protein product [Digitaria exilis]